jgi:hypothetical protein
MITNPEDKSSGDAVEPWMVDGAQVLYFAVFPTRGTEDVYEGEIDGEPWPIGPKQERFVVRLRNMDERYRQMYSRSVVPYVSLKYISKSEFNKER